MKGEMPGMGPYHGLAVHGYDNIAKKFVCHLDRQHSTSMAQGEGELSKDGKTITWTFTCNCPLHEEADDDAADRDGHRPRHEDDRDVRRRARRRARNSR